MDSKCEERENQQYAKIRCLLSTSVPTCFGHHYDHLQENKDRVLLHMVYCSHPTTQRPTAATNHIQQNQSSTPYAVTHGLCSPEDGHNDARNMLRQKLIKNTWLLHLVIFLSLHALLTMHGQRNLKISKQHCHWIHRGKEIFLIFLLLCLMNAKRSERN